jgi:hypothetical protein
MLTRLLRAWWPVVPILLGVIVNIGQNFSDVQEIPVIAWWVIFWLIIEIVVLISERITSPKVKLTGFQREDVPTTIRAYEWLDVQGGMPTGTTNMTTDVITFVHEPNIQRLGTGQTFERWIALFRNSGARLRDAEDVHAKLTFYHADSLEKILEHEQPRWSGRPTPDYPQTDISIKANGKPEGLIFLIRQRGADIFYAFSEASYRQNIFEPMNDNLRLGNGALVIQIEMKDKGGWEDKYWIRVLPDAGGEPKIKELKMSDEKLVPASNEDTDYTDESGGDGHALTREEFLEALKKASQPDPKPPKGKKKGGGARLS